MVLLQVAQTWKISKKEEKKLYHFCIILDSADSGKKRQTFYNFCIISASENLRKRNKTGKIFRCYFESSAKFYYFVDTMAREKKGPKLYNFNVTLLMQTLKIRQKWKKKKNYFRVVSDTIWNLACGKYYNYCFFKGLAYLKYKWKFLQLACYFGSCRSGKSKRSKKKQKFTIC